jgi:hypothetical protein
MLEITGSSPHWWQQVDFSFWLAVDTPLLTLTHAACKLHIKDPSHVFRSAGEK